MKPLFILVISTLLISCAPPKMIPLKGNYDDKPFEITTTSDFNTVWDKIIEFFAKTGVGIKLIDRSSGLIVAQNTAAPVTRELSDGSLANPEAWVVTTKMYDPGSQKYYYPEAADIEWNIRIKASPDNTTLININLTNIAASVTVAQYNPIVPAASTIGNYRQVTKSTRVFEKKISDYIK